MKKKYLILPLSIMWVTNMYSATSANSNIGQLTRKMLPFSKSAQNSNNNNGKNRKNKNRKMSWLARKMLRNPDIRKMFRNRNNSDKNKVKLDIETQTALMALSKKASDMFHLYSISKGKNPKNKEEEKEILYKAAQDVIRSKATASDGALAKEYFKKFIKKKLIGTILRKCGKIYSKLNPDGHTTISLKKNKFETLECQKLLETIRKLIHY